MGFSLQLPQSGQSFATEGAKVAGDMTTIQTWGNGQILGSDLSATAAIATTQIATGFGRLALRTVSSNVTANNGDLVQANGTFTITLPAISQNAVIGIQNLGGPSAALTVNAGTSQFLQGGGVAGATTLTLGQLYSYVVVIGNSANSSWYVVSGQQDTGWVNLTLGTNIGVLSGAYTPTARLVGDRIALRGVAQNNTGSGFGAGTLATIPAGLRPASTVVVALACTQSGALSYQIATTGIISPLGGTAPNTSGISFDGVSFSLT